MKVTFVSNSRVLGYRPGQVYTAELTPQLRGLLGVGRHLTLLDPLDLDSPIKQEQLLFDAPEPEVKIDGSKKSSSNSEERRSFSFPNN